MPILLLPFLIMQLIAGTWLGAALRNRRPATSAIVIAAVCLYVVLCIFLVTLAVQYPGPANRYAAGSEGYQIRRMVIGPTQFLWLCGPFVVAFSVAYVRAKRLYADRQVASRLWHVHTILISFLFLPFWLAGLVIHMAHYAGAWL